jgi:putative transposase
MQLVEQHIIEKGDPRWARLDTGAFASKNLWNAANYLVRQSFIHHGIYLDNVKVFHQVKSHEAYRALPAKISKQVLIQLHQAWKGFFEAMDEWQEHPEKFVGRPKLPSYKPKEHGRNLLVYEFKAISKRALKGG